MKLIFIILPLLILIVGLISALIANQSPIKKDQQHKRMRAAAAFHKTLLRP